MAHGGAHRAKSCGSARAHGIFAADSRPPGPSQAVWFMTFLSTVQHIARGSRRHRRGHMIPIMLGGAVTAGAIALVAYLLWPTWGTGASSSPARLPVSVGATLFNVPTMAVRRKIQRHSGPQERVDLGFTFPSLEASDAAEACQRRYRGGIGAADRPDLPVDLGASRHAGAGHAACAPSIHAISTRLALRRRTA